MTRPFSDVGVQHARQSEFVQRRRSQLPRNEVDVLIDARQRFKGCGNLRALLRRGLLERFQREPQRRQALTETIVKFASESASLLFLRDHEPP